MKHLKTFENINVNEPKIGDYAICNDSNKNYLNKFLLTNIGKIVDINIYKYYPYIVNYDNVPEDYYEAFSHPTYIDSRDFKREEILYFSENIEDLKAILKYNL